MASFHLLKKHILWLVVWKINSIFPYIGFLIIPIDELIFFRGWPNHQPAYFFDNSLPLFFSTLVSRGWAQQLHSGSLVTQAWPQKISTFAHVAGSCLTSHYDTSFSSTCVFFSVCEPLWIPEVINVRRAMGPDGEYHITSNHFSGL